MSLTRGRLFDKHRQSKVDTLPLTRVLFNFECSHFHLIQSQLHLMLSANVSHTHTHSPSYTWMSKKSLQRQWCFLWGMTHAITNLSSGAGLCRGSLKDSVPFTCWGWEEMKRRQINWLSGLWLCSDLRGWELSAWGSDVKPHLLWSLRGHVLAARQESVGQVCLCTSHTLSIVCLCAYS